MKDDIMIPHIRSASREMVRQFGLLNNQFSSIGSTSQCHALVELDAHGVMHLGQLSMVLNLEKSTTSRLITQMSENGACQIQADENDRRNKLISLTKKGQVLVNKIHVHAKLQVQQALDLMSEEEKHLVVRGMSIYAKALKRSQLLTEYTVRKLHKNDLPQLINLIKTVRSEFGFDPSHPDTPHFESELNAFYDTYTVKGSHYLVLVQDKKIVGGAGFAPLAGGNADICELKSMYLSAQLRGLGLGSFLFQQLLPEAKQYGFNKCYLETMDFMHGANSLYKKLGFKLLQKPLGNTGHSWTNCWYLREI